MVRRAFIWFGRMLGVLARGGRPGAPGHPHQAVKSDAVSGLDSTPPPVSPPPQPLSQTEPRVPFPAPQLPADRDKAQPVMARPSVTFTVGLDFGTYSTKIVVRRRGDISASLMTVEPPVHGYPPFVSPSVVRVQDGRLWFGGQALCHTRGTLYRSSKVHLLPPELLIDEFLPPEAPEGSLAPEFVVAAYLSWVFSGIRQKVEALYPTPAVRLQLNVGAPMHHLEHPGLKGRYLRVIQAVWESVCGAHPFPVHQGIELDDVCCGFERWLRDEAAVPGPEVREYEVHPETIAPLVSLARDPRMSPGMYLVVDMGAGTTEISVNKVHSSGRVLCWFDQSVPIGGDHLGGDPAVLAAAVRHFAHDFRTTWGRGYLRVAGNLVARKEWKELTVVRFGGATKHPDVGGVISGGREIMYAFPNEDRVYRVMTHNPTGIQTAPEGDGYDGYLLAVAHGLSVPRRQWPIFYEPGQLDNPPPTPVRELTDRDADI